MTEHPVAALTRALAWAAQDQPRPQGFPPEMIWMLVGIFFLFYFIVLRPQKMEQRKREEMIDAVAKGDQVVTAGGIHGTVESVDREKGLVTLNVAPKVNMRFNRVSISTVTQKKNKPKEETAKNKK